MFRLLMAILSLTSINTLAQTELPKLAIAEVKEAIQRINPESTCVDLVVPPWLSLIQRPQV